MTTERNVSRHGPIGRIENLFAKFLEFFNADDSNRFRDGFPPLVIDRFSVLEFFKWHRTTLFGDSRESELSRLYSSPWNRAKNNKTI